MIRTKPITRKQREMRKPQKPEKGHVQYLRTVLGSTCDRVQYFPSSEYDDAEDDEPLSESRQMMCLNDIDAIVKKAGVDRKDVFFTAELLDDYLVLEVMHVKKLSYKEREEKYKNDMIDWDAQQRQIEQRRLDQIERDMESLKREAGELKKKNA